MNYTFEDKNGWMIIKISGKVTIDYVNELENYFNNLLDRTDLDLTGIGLDLSQIAYIDSSALGLFIRIMNITKFKNIKFIIFDTSPEALTIFKTAYLEKYFDIMTREDFIQKYIEI